MPARERRVDVAPQTGCSPPAIPVPSHNLGVRGLPTSPLSSLGQAGHEYPGMPRSAEPRRRLVAVPSPLFPAGAVLHHGGWSSIREHDSAPPPSSNAHALQGPQAVWAIPTPSWSARRDSPLPQKNVLRRARRTLTIPAIETQGTGPRTSHELRQRQVQMTMKFLQFDVGLPPW